MRRLVGFILPLLVLSTAGADDLYVSPKGSDTASGSKQHPFATLGRARDAVRKVSKDQDVTIWIEGGDYYFDSPFRLAADDSGTASHPVTYRAVDGETPRLLGGRSLGAADFHQVSDPATLTRIPKELRGKIVELDLTKAGVKNAGSYPDVFHDRGFMADLFCDGRRLPLARYPKKGYMTFEKVLDNAGGPTDWKNPAVSTKKVDPNGPGGTFQYRDGDAGKFETWKGQLDRGVWLRGYWRVTWEVSGIRLASIDTAAHTATFAKPIAGGIGNKYTRPAGNGRESYWVMNLLEELTEPGEWCVDFKDRKIYFYPPSRLGQSEILLADEAAPVVALDGASHVNLVGLTLEANLGDGIRITGGEANMVAGCTVKNMDKYAVVLDGGKNNTLLSCDLHHLGAGGVWLGGGDEASQPRVPAGHRVINNHIHDFSELSLVYAPGVNCGFTGGGGGGHHPAVGMLVAHNLIHDTPHGGVLFGSMDSVFEYNEIYRWCLVSNDLGAFYSYDLRTRHFGNITFRYNFMHDSRIGDGIYFDHDHPDMKMIGNIAFLRSDGKRGTGFLLKHGSMDKDGVAQTFECRNNVAVACKTGFEFVSMLPHLGTIADNVAVQCAQPFVWRAVESGKTTETNSFASGSNLACESNPGFKDIEKLDFRLAPDNRLLKDLPGFKAIPVESIGLYIDSYRKKLPTEEELDRVGVHHPQDGGLGYDILDRPHH
ncbi:MAG: right-handed parallel beta-helix repeat-containing protein [bacterium]